MALALEGIRVLEVAQWWFVPSAGAVLSDWGADVIKIEHPTFGDPQRGLITSGMVPSASVNYMIDQPNRGKRSVGLDLKSPGGVEILYRLAETSDVFLTSFLPSARQKLEIDVEHIRARNPNIVYVRGSGQGTRGPDSDKAGYDGTSFWCRGGIADALTPPTLERPVGARPAFGDGIGGMTLAGGIAAALLRRERTGEPSVVDVSLLATAMWTLCSDINASQFAKPGAAAGPPRGFPANPVVHQYLTADGRWVQLMLLQADRDWADFCRHIDRPDLIDDPRFADMATRAKHAGECVQQIAEVFAARPLAEWREKLASMRGAWTVVQTAGEVREDPQATANGYVRPVEAPDGTGYTLVANPVQFDEVPVDLTPGPEHGQHTEEVLLELGLSWEEIVEHKGAGAVL